MGTVRLGSFPSLNNKKITDTIDKDVFAYFLNHFPRNFFANTYMDNQTGLSGNYVVNSNGELVKIESGKKLNNPTCRFSIRHGANITIDPFGGDIWNVNQQPGAFGVDTDLTGYRPILYDPYGVIVAMNERTVRSQFDFIMTFESKDDQLACCNYLDMNLKMNYVNVFPSRTFIPIHRLMVEYLRASIFKSEINILSKMKSETDDKQSYQNKINEMFMKHLYQFSETHIKPYSQLDPNNKDSDFVYGYWQNQRITIKFDKYEADEGTKKGNVWSNFGVTVSGWIEYANPIGFITSVPAIIRGTKNNWRMKTSTETDRNNYYHLMKFKEVFKDTRHLRKVNGNIYQHFYLEKEIMMSSSIENFNILDDVINKDESPKHYSVMKALLSTIRSQEDFDRLFYVVIYKNDEPLSYKYYSIDKEFNFNITNCDLSVPYYIDIFVNKQNYSAKIEEMNKFLNELGVDTTGTKKRYPNGFGTINTIAGTTTDSSGDIIELVQIAPTNFLSIDPDFTYYFKITENDTDKFYKVSENQIYNNENADLYVYDGSQYVMVDRNKVLIPNPSIVFYTYDRGTNKFIKQSNLTSFDRLQTYYVSSGDIDHGSSINIYMETGNDAIASDEKLYTK